MELGELGESMQEQERLVLFLVERSLFSGPTIKERRWFLNKGDVVDDLGAGSFSLDKKGCLVLGVKEGADGGLGDGCLRWLLSQVLRERFKCWKEPMQDKVSGAKDLPRASSILIFESD